MSERVYRPGDLIEVRERDGVELLLVLAVDGERALCVDLLDGMCGGWLPGPRGRVLSEDEREARLDAIRRRADERVSEAERWESQARFCRSEAERAKAMIDHARSLAHAVAKGSR